VGKLAFYVQSNKDAPLMIKNQKKEQGGGLDNEQLFQQLVGGNNNSSDLAWKTLAAVGQKVLELSPKQVEQPVENKREEKSMNQPICQIHGNEGADDGKAGEP
jgi:hypothetical protein